MTYTAGSMDRQQLMDEFGLNAEGLASSNTGSSTGVKSNPLLGTGYLTDDDTQRLLNNENLKNAFIEMNGGQTAAESSESPWGSLVGETDSWETVNDVDSVLDWLSKEPPKEDPAPIAHQIDTPAPVAVAAAVEQPIEGIDYMTPEMNDAYDRIQAYTNATHEFTAGDQITRTPEPDYDTAQAAQDFKDKYTFEIAQNLQPSAQSVVNALATAIPGKLGVYS